MYIQPFSSSLVHHLTVAAIGAAAHEHLDATRELVQGAARCEASLKDPGAILLCRFVSMAVVAADGASSSCRCRRGRRGDGGLFFFIETQQGLDLRGIPQHGVGSSSRRNTHIARVRGPRTAGKMGLVGASKGVRRECGFGRSIKF